MVRIYSMDWSVSLLWLAVSEYTAYSSMTNRVSSGGQAISSHIPHNLRFSPGLNLADDLCSNLISTVSQHVSCHYTLSDSIIGWVDTVMSEEQWRQLTAPFSLHHHEQQQQPFPELFWWQREQMGLLLCAYWGDDLNVFPTAPDEFIRSQIQVSKSVRQLFLTLYWVMLMVTVVSPALHLWVIV